MSEKTLKIGALARLTKTNPAAIREYEALGLLLTAERAGGELLTHGPWASRVYNDADVRRLTFLRRCRDFGLLNPRLKLLIQFVDDGARASPEARELMTTLLQNVRDQANELDELCATLEGLLSGAGKDALPMTVVDTTPSDGMKRMRRRVRKPFKTPSDD